MKLYHFTKARNVPSIIETGLRANPLAFGVGEIIGGLKRQRGVWLTELDNLRVTADESAAYFKMSGECYRHWLHDKTEDNLARITIRIGDNDQRLIRFNSGQPEFARIEQRTRLFPRLQRPKSLRS
jgi:hypothetical protein